MAKRLLPLVARAEETAGLRLAPLIAANALHGLATDEQRREVLRGLGSEVVSIDWTRTFRGEQMDDVVHQIRLGALGSSPTTVIGRGVTVAVLDSGIYADHPFLKVTAAVSTCPEPRDIPGRHGTHCAGVIASTHPEFPGIAPGVSLIDVKIADTDGWTSPAYLARGIDEAMDRGADILSISFGLNSLPSTVPDGHGWQCRDGHCILCRAADHAVGCGVLVVAAAGNERLRFRALRETRAKVLGTDLLCPGQARRVITVGAIEKEPAEALLPTSSRGPTAYGFNKPELVAPGAGVVSTVLADPRDKGKPPRFAFFGSASGTSVATAVTAGALALLIERQTSTGSLWTAEAIRDDLLACHTRPHKSSTLGRPVRVLDLLACRGTAI